MKTSTGFQMIIMALSYMQRRRLRTLLTTLAIVFGVSLLFAVQLIIPSMMDAFSQSTYPRSADLTIMNDAGLAFDPAEPARLIANTDGVAGVTGVLYRRIVLPDTDDFIATKLDVMGIDPATSAQVHTYHLSTGRMLAAGDQRVAVVARGAAELGQIIELTTVEGVSAFEVIGVLDGSAPDVPRVYVPLDTLGTLLNQPGLVTALEIALTPGSDPDQVAARLTATLPEGFTTGEVSDDFAAAQLGYTMMYTMGLIALFLGAFLIFNTFRTIVAERRRDTGLLRAVGATRQQIMQLMLIESLLQGVVGTLIGLAAGYLLANVMVTTMQSSLDPNAAEAFSHIKAEVTLSSVLFAAGMGLITTLLAGLIPAWQASKTSPLVALRPASTTSFKQTARWGLIVGLIVLALAAGLFANGDQTAPLGAVVFLAGLLIIAPSLVLPAANLFEPLMQLWFAREGDIARSNMVRQPGRAAITASTLMIGLAVVVQLATTTSGYSMLQEDLIDRSLGHDVLLTTEAGGTYGNVVGADAVLKEKLRALPDVAMISDWRYASSHANGERLDVIGIDPATFPILTPQIFDEGHADEAYAQLAAGRAMIINPAMATLQNLSLGDTFDLPTAQGPQPYQVVGVANEFMTFKMATIWISQTNIEADFNKTDSVMLMIKLAPDADQAAALTHIQAVMQDYPQFKVELTAAYRDEMLATLKSSNWMNYGLALLIMGPAALGLINTLAINILERTREIGVVRAIGASRRQSQRIVIAEALFLGMFGAALGVIAGVVMSYGFTLALGSIGWETPYIFPTEGIISAVIVALLLALVASILPARHAAQLDIIRALHYE